MPAILRHSWPGSARKRPPRWNPGWSLRCFRRRHPTPVGWDWPAIGARPAPPPPKDSPMRPTLTLLLALLTVSVLATAGLAQTDEATSPTAVATCSEIVL